MKDLGFKNDAERLVALELEYGKDSIEYKSMSQYLKNQLTAKRASARYTLILKKAKEAGITVTDAEIEEYLKEHSK
jgi:hypothetical protein